MSTAFQVVVDGVIIGGFYALMAQGLSLIFGVMRVINLAHGQMLLVGAYLAWTAQQHAHLDALVALPLIMLVGYGVGWIVARLTVLRVVERPQLMGLLLTFGLAFVIQGILAKFFSTTPHLTSSSYSDGVIDMLGVRVATPRVLMLAAALVLLGVVVVFLQRTRAGKAMQAAAQNKEAARIVGININRTYAAAFGLGTAMAFGAGVLFSTTQSFTPVMGEMFTLKAFVIVVLGGTGRLWGTFVAAMFVGLVESGLASYVPNIGTGLGLAAAFVLVVVALVIRPQGIAGKVVTA